MGGAPPLYRRPAPAAQTYTLHGFRGFGKENPCRAGKFFLADYALQALKASKIQTPPRPSQSSPEKRGAREGGFGTWGLSPLGCDALNFLLSGPLQGASSRAQI